jgi:hypothetical protein
MNRRNSGLAKAGALLLAVALALVAGRLSANTSVHGAAVAQGNSTKEGRAIEEAVGYSKNFSFDEAFKDAMKNLPQHKPSHPDEMTNITVVEIGAQLGGIAGLRQLVVRIRASTD